MPEEYGNPGYFVKWSDEFKDYMSDLPRKHFEEYGDSEFTQKYCKQILRFQNYDAGYNVQLIGFDTAICQPIICQKDGVINIVGVKDYNPQTQSGTFLHTTISGTLTVENVHSYHVYIRKFDKYLPCRRGFVFDFDELKDIYISAIVKDGNKYKWVLYKNTQLLCDLGNVFECEYISNAERANHKDRKGYVIFAQKGKTNYRNFLCDIQTQEIFELDPSEKLPSWFYYELSHELLRSEKVSWWQRKKHLIYDGFSMNIILHLDNSKISQVVGEFIKKADKYVVLENLFSDDDTVNIMVSYNQNPDAIRFLYYCYTKHPEMFGHGIWGMSIDELEVGTRNCFYEYRNVYQHSKYYLARVKHINQALYEYCSEKIRINELPHKVYDNCISSHDMEVFMRNRIDFSKGFDEEKKLFDDIFNQLAASHNLTTKWKNEYSLYILIHKKYSDAIYQYHCEWLGNQSLDIFIPSLNLAVEYQGKQHYEAVNFFGGEEKLREQQTRDQRKKKLCLENRVYLLEWRYDEPVSLPVLKAKLHDYIKS